MNEVWLVTADCGDYYCGCGQGHIVACASTAKGAAILREELLARPRMGNPNDGVLSKMNYGPFADLAIYGPVPLNAPNEPEFMSGFRA